MEWCAPVITVPCGWRQEAQELKVSKTKKARLSGPGAGDFSDPSHSQGARRIIPACLRADLKAEAEKTRAVQATGQ